jgi:tetratricopeptide (TPR) repeat protein
MLRFEYPILLYALLAIPLMVLLLLLFRRWKNKMRLRIGDAQLVDGLLADHLPRRFLLKGVLAIIALTLLGVAMANLRQPDTAQKVSRNGIDVMIALDVSRSMLAEDIKPNRLERAKQMLGKLIDKLSNDRIGLVVFAGKSYLQMPLTADHAAARLFLSSASTDMVPSQGTVIGEALKMCGSFFVGKEKKYKSIVMISDGEDHDEEAGAIAEQLADNGVSIITVGIGSPEGSPIIDEATKTLKKDNDGNTVVSKLNEGLLQQLAQKGKGRYQRFTNSDEVAAVVAQQLNSMDKRNVTDFAGGGYYSFAPWLLLAALLLLLIEMVLSERKKRQKRITGPVIAAGLLFPAMLSAQDSTQLKKGNDAYRQKAYDKAAALYKTVTDKNSNNTVAQYNLGNALYKNKQGEEALTAFDKALATAKTPAEKAKILYNKGVVLQNGQKIPDCIQAYKDALKLNPGDEDTRLNLQKALKQQKKQQDDDKKKKKNQQDDNKKKQPEQDEPKDDKQDPKNQPRENKPQPSRISKKEAEQKLKALSQQEKNLQEKLRKTRVTTVQKDKDW